jgi:hypothetical protein
MRKRVEGLIMLTVSLNFRVETNPKERNCSRAALVDKHSCSRLSFVNICFAFFIFYFILCTRSIHKLATIFFFEFYFQYKKKRINK